MRAVLSLLCAPGIAWAHPGHGEALHAHAELAALVVVVLVAAAIYLGRRP